MTVERADRPAIRCARSGCAWIRLRSPQVLAGCRLRRDPSFASLLGTRQPRRLPRFSTGGTPHPHVFRKSVILKGLACTFWYKSAQECDSKGDGLYLRGGSCVTIFLRMAVRRGLTTQEHDSKGVDLPRIAGTRRSRSHPRGEKPLSRHWNVWRWKPKHTQVRTIMAYITRKLRSCQGVTD